MDYYQGVAFEYLRADRAVFVNTECCIQLNPGKSVEASGEHWYCDAIAVDLRAETVWLCEVSYSAELGSLLKRLGQWKTHWPELKRALARDCRVTASWPVRPWLFIPEKCLKDAIPKIKVLLPASIDPEAMPRPRITTLEAVVPWHYRTWDREGENLSHKEAIPGDMKV